MRRVSARPFGRREPIRLSCKPSVLVLQRSHSMPFNREVVTRDPQLVPPDKAALAARIADVLRSPPWQSRIVNRAERSYASDTHGKACARSTRTCSSVSPSPSADNRSLASPVASRGVGSPSRSKPRYALSAQCPLEQPRGNRRARRPGRCRQVKTRCRAAGHPDCEARHDRAHRELSIALLDRALRRQVDPATQLEQP